MSRRLRILRFTLLCCAAMANPVFAQITAQPTAVFPTRAGDVVLVNQDELLHGVAASPPFRDAYLVADQRTESGDGRPCGAIGCTMFAPQAQLCCTVWPGVLHVE